MKRKGWLKTWINLIRHRPEEVVAVLEPTNATTKEGAGDWMDRKGSVWGGPRVVAPAGGVRCRYGILTGGVARGAQPPAVFVGPLAGSGERGGGEDGDSFDSVAGGGI